MKRAPNTTLWTAGFALLFVTAAWGDDHNRASMTLNEAGEVLRFVGSEDNAPTAVFESGGSSTDILGHGDMLQSEEVFGFGNIADLNDAGVAVMKVTTADPLPATTDCCLAEDEQNQFLVTSDNGSAPNVIAVATRSGTGSTTFGDSILCKIGPMPENNNAGQVAWFGALRASDATDFDCEDVDDGVPESSVWGTSFSSNDYEYDYEDLVAGGMVAESDTELGDLVTGDLLFDEGTTISTESSAIFRYSPGPGSSVLLLEGRADRTGDTITVTDSRFVSSSTTFDVLEVRYIRDGTQKMNAAGHLLGYAQLIESEPEARGEQVVAIEDCQAIVDRVSGDRRRYLPLCLPVAILAFEGNTPTVVAMTGGVSPYSLLPDEGHVLNNSGAVLFKAYDTDNLARLELYRPGFGTTTIAMQGDPLPTPGSDLFFCDFPPHYDLADDGSLAFQAEISNVSGADCEDLADDRGFSGDGRTALFHYDSGQFTELMRTADMAALDTGPGPFQSTWSGNDITEISSVAISATSGLVQFFAENEDFEPTSCTALRGSDDDFGGGEWTAMLSWTPDSGLESVMEEGELLGTDPDDRIFRIYAMGPKLRAQANSSAELVALLAIDRDDDCDVDEDDEMAPGGEQVIVIGRGTPPPGSVLEIPMAGPLGLGLFASALMLLSLMWVRSRTVGV